MNVLLGLVVLLGSATAQEAGVDEVKVAGAIKKGIDYLIANDKSPGHAHSKAKHSDELILYTFIHAEVPESHPRFQRMLKRVLTDPLHQTYKVALQAMLLEELDRVKYQPRILQCAQHLVDNQCPNGQWSYGEPTAFVEGTPTTAPVASGSKRKPGLRRFGAAAKKEKPKVVRYLKVVKRRDGNKASGDNSNSQYAALGLRACHDSGIILPENVIGLAIKWWKESQHQGVKNSGYGGVRGWNYRKEDGKQEAYGSMTVGAAGSLCIYSYIAGRDWKRDPAVVAGVNWEASNFTVTKNPGRNNSWYFYYLYGLERLGVLYDTKKIGKHDWYAEGANHLLKIQQKDGSWKGDHEDVWNTCFAILFLKKATRPLVISEDNR